MSSSSLLIYWLNQSENIPLVEGDYSFHSVAFDWMEQVWNPIETIDSASQRLRKKATFAEVNWSREDYLHRWNQTIKFLDYFGENAGSQWEVPTIELPKEKFDRKLDFKTDNTVIADLSRRLVLATKYLGKTPLGTPKISLKASFRDAARAVDFRHILSPGEFRKFYSDNRKVFPNFLTFNIFMQILLNELRMPPKMLAYYKRAIFGNDIGSISLSVPGFISSRSRTFQANSSDPNESDNVEKRLLNDLAKELGKDDSTGEAQDLIDRILREQENINAEETRETERRGLASIERIEDDFGDYPDENEYGEDEDEEVSNEENSERTITGGDSTFCAAYENMSYRDTADDGIDDITADGKSSFDDQGDDFEFARETDRVTERLAFIYSTVKLWKFATCRCPLLTTLSTGSFDDATFSDARLRLEDWRDQAIKFKNDLEVLLDQTSRYRVPQPSGTNESLAEYDQLRGSKEILLDRIVWTIVEVEDAIVFLKSALRDESVERYAKSWKSLALQTFGAMFRGDVKLVQHLWPDLTSKLEKETLLYIPTSRGGDAKSIVECRFLQQVVLCLLKFAPRLGLLQETFHLIECVQKMEQIRLSTPGSITEYDRLVETAARGVTETLAESAKSWRTESGQSLAPSRDETLIYYLTEASDVILKFWLSHSQQIRISSVEAIATNSRWKVVKEFVQKYGSDLFTQEFLAFRNIRAILHQGAQNYLSSLIAMKRDNQDLENGEKIVSAILDGSENLDNVAGILETILECVAENYTTYVDYNTTTTQSDRGEMLYVLLDFLRVIASYERIYWNLKPVYWIHDSLIRAELHKAAELWKKRVREKSSGLAESSLREYDALKKRYGVALQSVHDRLRERFVRPLDIAQMCGLVYDAISEVRKCGENNPVFQELEKEVESFAATPSGVGFEAPEWLTLLQDEVVLSRVDAKEERRENETKEDPFESVAFISIKKMSCEEIETQLCAALRNVGIGSGGHF